MMWLPLAMELSVDLAQMAMWEMERSVQVMYDAHTIFILT